jgi:hypothetical protein
MKKEYIKEEISVLVGETMDILRLGYVGKVS